jgi:hypothetical protein
MVIGIHKPLVDHIDAFLASSGLSSSYFGKAATGNSEVVARLKAGRTITGLTEQKLMDFMASRSADLVVVASDQSGPSCSAVPVEGS